VSSASELRELSLEEMETRLAETKEELFNLRFQNATGQLDNYRRLGILRREIARIHTVMRERQLAESGERG
jgi:large subunit ribosomal protein L29